MNGSPLPPLTTPGDHSTAPSTVRNSVVAEEIQQRLGLQALNAA
jgi:hypothetical protein